MRTTEISRELSTAITFLEDLLNDENGENLLDTIKQYKELKNTSDADLTNYSLD